MLDEEDGVARPVRRDCPDVIVTDRVDARKSIEHRAVVEPFGLVIDAPIPGKHDLRAAGDVENGDCPLRSAS